MSGTIVEAINQYGFPIIAAMGLGYFVYYVWQTINKVIDPAVMEMKTTIIRLTDQLRLLDQDMIRLQTKVNTVLKNKNKEVLDDGKEEENKKGNTRKRNTKT